ncbi:energy-coupling factor transporter transmembrane component T family protein [Natronosalvus rutilus]|uniref:Energy-coupling factor transporter transmembrane protein EcfT n=1 Tax=Natronosalvus rutilus TaxID=2953753 RepID=A0A9E7SWI0_9EURY|nr:energy-coupling factor transporter transmembrane component T [Natronosalvus rutilus]UTF55077.1 energy-coupling factor transporter transmembrane protein EcfT [Natronosalvus rutilus]
MSLLTYEPDETLAHRLDPRSKLAVQIGFSVAALAHPEPGPLAVFTMLALGFLWSAGVSPLGALVAYRFVLPVLLVAPVVAALSLGPPWFDPIAAVDPALASYRVLLIVLVSAAYVRSTPVRASRAAIQRTIPGKPGQVLGMGVALVFRFLPILLADLRTIRDAAAARLGTERGLLERVTHLATTALERAFLRADRLAIAMQARCFAWNPTLPTLRFALIDAPVLVLALLLTASAVI